MTFAIRTSVLVFTVALILGCSSLPDSAAPKGRVVDDPNSLDRSEWISYRLLTRDDFEAAAPPREFASNVDRIGAATCAVVLAAPGARIEIQPTPSSDGGFVYHAAIRDLRLQAQMDRSCSWWNPESVGLPEDYILEHEQIHFALFELEARRLNASLPELEARLHATGTSAKSATEAVQNQVNEWLRGQLPGILQRSRDFDEDTSMGHKPEQQKRWWNNVQSRLSGASD